MGLTSLKPLAHIGKSEYRDLTDVRSAVLCTIMKTVPISELRQRVADVINEVEASGEPTVVLQRSRRAAYIVNPERYERDQQELSLLRRQLFVAEVREAEGEYHAGDARRFDDVEELLDELRS